MNRSSEWSEIVHRGLFISGLISPLALPLLVVAIQQQFTLFHYPEINTVIPLTFLFTGIATGALIRAWWSPIYIMVLGSALTIAGLALSDDPRGEADAILIVGAFTLIPTMMIGALLGTGIGLLGQRWLAE